MAPRPNGKGFWRLSLVTCPIALFPATSESEKISFNQINKKTGHRIRYLEVDAGTGEEAPSDDIVKGYQIDKDRYLEVTKDELENIALESTRTIEIDEFVPRSEIDDLYLVRPYYIVPDGKVGHDAFAVIRETIRSQDKVALARVVLTNREPVIALEARDKGLMGMLLRYPYEVRDASEYFDDIQDVKITKDMLDLAKHIVEQKSGHFEPAEIRGPLRDGAGRAARQEAEGAADRGGEEIGAPQRREPDGCPARQPRLLWQGRGGCQAREESRQAEAQGRLTCAGAPMSPALRRAERDRHSMISYSNATPAGSLSASQRSAASSVVKTFSWSNQLVSIDVDPDGFHRETPRPARIGFQFVGCRRALRATGQARRFAHGTDSVPFCLDFRFSLPIRCVAIGLSPLP
jgi:DNA end-binding protein Ku